MSVPSRRRHSRWLWLSLLPFGFGSWTPILVGLRCGVRRWTVVGGLWLTFVLVGWTLAAVEPSGEGPSGGLIVLGWCGSIATSLWIRRGYDTGGGTPASERVRWPEPTARSQGWSVRYALVAYACSFAGTVALVSLLRSGFGIHLRVGVRVLIVDTALLGSLLPLRRRRGLSHDDLGLRAVPAAESIGLGVLALIAYGLIAVFWVILVRPKTGADALANVKGEGTGDVVLAIVAVAAIAPIVEEVFFRGLLYRSLRNRLSILPAALLAGALFGLVHISGYPLDTLPLKAAFGVIACLLYERTGSLLPGIVLHSIGDASAIDLALTGNALIALASFCLLIVVLIVRPGMRRPAREKGGVRRGEAAAGDAHECPELSGKTPRPLTRRGTGTGIHRT